MSWEKVRIGKVLNQYRIEHWVQNDVSYKQVTISKYDGISFRGKKLGSEIGRKRQFLIDLKKYPNTLLFIRQGVQDGGIGVAPFEVDGCIVTENMPMFSIEGINVDYLNFIIKSPIFKDELSKLVPTGSAQKAIHEKQLLEIEIPLPATVEQEEIVFRLNNFEIGFQDLQKELDQQQTYLQLLRQTILQEAVQGKLTKPDPTDEPATNLLKRIKAEKEKELPPITEDEIPFELPEGWVWCKIDSLILDESKDLRTGPFGSSLNKSEHKKQGVPVLGIESISKQGEFLEKNKIFVTKDKAEELKSFYVKGGDLILSRSGTIGELCVLPHDIEPSLISTNLLKISLNQNIINSTYFCHVIKGSNHIDESLSDFCGGTTRLFITQTILKKLIFPLPPLAEQQRIVAKVQQLQQQLSQLEAQVQQSRQYAQQLLQSVLKKAFEGNGKV